ncbi:MAG: helix-hairpin-helix domain-containing protein, partial [candidate division WOR-3 bacterium]
MLFFVILSIITQIEFIETDTEKDYQILVDEIEKLKHAPLDLNTVTIYDLARLPGLSIVTAYRIIEYREEVGPYHSLEDLLKVEGMDRETFEMIRPYLQIKKKEIPGFKFWGRYRLVSELPRAERGEEIYSRTVFEYHQQKGYLVSEKDPGEDNYFDYTGFGVVISQGQRRFALGSYNLDFARGLILGSMPTIFEGTDCRIFYTNRGIVPYTSVIEDRGYFGVAYTDSFFLKYTLFGSGIGLDARLDTSGNVTSIDHSGNHIDSLTMSRKNNLHEEILGTNLEKHIGATNLGLRSYYLRYNRCFAPDDSLSSFYGRDFFILGGDIGYLREDFFVFGELARSFNNRWAGTGGFIGDYSPFKVSAVLSYFADGFYSPKSEMVDNGTASAIGDLRYRLSFGTLYTSIKLTRLIESDSNDCYFKIGVDIPWSPFQVSTQVKRRYREGLPQSIGSTVNLKYSPLNYLRFYLRLEEKYLYLEKFEKGIAGFLGSEVKFKFLSLEGR